MILATPEQGAWEVFHQLWRGGALPARLFTDAYFPPLARANGCRLVSFERDFECFSGLERLAVA